MLHAAAAAAAAKKIRLPTHSVFCASDMQTDSLACLESVEYISHKHHARRSGTGDRQGVSTKAV